MWNTVTVIKRSFAAVNVRAADPEVVSAATQPLRAPCDAPELRRSRKDADCFSPLTILQSNSRVPSFEIRKELNLWKEGREMFLNPDKKLILQNTDWVGGEVRGVNCCELCTFTSFLFLNKRNSDFLSAEIKEAGCESIGWKELALR